MTDFFSDLERQLVEAASERRQRIRRARLRRTAALASVVLLVVAAGGGVSAALSQSDGGSGGNPGAPAATAPTQTVTVSPKTGAILARQVVAVLNGTPTPGLARAVATRLQNAHVTIGNVTEAADQSRATTCVTFAPGHEGAARRVAAVLGLPASVVAPATSADRAIAGHATVIVTVGTDQNQAPSP
jgi:hypothetical protein